MARILVVEDDPASSATSSCRPSSEWGHEVDVARDGHEAYSPHLPGASRSTTSSSATSCSRRMQGPDLLTSGGAPGSKPDARRRGERQGTCIDALGEVARVGRSGVLRKPFELEDLRKTVEQALAQRETLLGRRSRARGAASRELERASTTWSARTSSSSRRRASIPCRACPIAGASRRTSARSTPTSTATAPSFADRAVRRRRLPALQRRVRLRGRRRGHPPRGPAPPRAVTREGDTGLPLRRRRVRRGHGGPGPRAGPSSVGRPPARGAGAAPGPQGIADAELVTMSVGVAAANEGSPRSTAVLCARRTATSSPAKEAGGNRVLPRPSWRRGRLRARPRAGTTLVHALLPGLPEPDRRAVHSSPSLREPTRICMASSPRSPPAHARGGRTSHRARLPRRGARRHAPVWTIPGTRRRSTTSASPIRRLRSTAARVAGVPRTAASRSATGARSRRSRTPRAAGRDAEVAVAWLRDAARRT